MLLQNCLMNGLKANTYANNGYFCVSSIYLIKHEWEYLNRAQFNWEIVCYGRCYKSNIDGDTLVLIWLLYSQVEFTVTVYVYVCCKMTAFLQWCYFSSLVPSEYSKLS